MINLSTHKGFKRILRGGGSRMALRDGKSRSYASHPAAADVSSYSFDGVDEYVHANGAAGAIDWDGSSSWSISVWFKDGGATASPLYIWSACSVTAATNRYMGISTFEAGGVGYVRFYGLTPSALTEATWSPVGGAGRIDVLATSPNGITPGDGNWHNVTLTVNTTASPAQGVKMYLDGVLAGYAQSASATIDWTKLVFGCRVQTNGAAVDAFFPGDIHQASIYGSELSAMSVAGLYNSGSPIDETAMSAVHFWRFGDGDSNGPSTLTDYGSGSADGTGVNLEAGDIVEASP